VTLRVRGRNVVRLDRDPWMGKARDPES